MGRPVLLLSLVLVLFTAVPADACQMCMGSSTESKTVAGVQAGILVLLIVTYTLLGWIFFLIVLCVRRLNHSGAGQGRRPPRHRQPAPGAGDCEPTARRVELLRTWPG